METHFLLLFLELFLFIYFYFAHSDGDNQIFFQIKCFIWCICNLISNIDSFHCANITSIITAMMRQHVYHHWEQVTEFFLPSWYIHIYHIHIYDQLKLFVVVLNQLWSYRSCTNSIKSGKKIIHWSDWLGFWLSFGLGLIPDFIYTRGFIPILNETLYDYISSSSH